MYKVIDGKAICYYKSNDLNNSKKELISSEEYNSRTSLKDIEG